jgi:exoribonuclease R
MLQTKNYIEFRVGDETFEGAEAARPALPGDSVQLESGKVVSVLCRAPHKNIVGVLEVASKTRYGFTKRGVPIYLFSPWNESYPPFYVASTVTDVSKNLLAVVDFIDWDSTMNLPRGDCREILGACGTLATEEAALARHACGAPWKLKDARVLSDPVSILPSGSLPLSATTFHVDPPGCRDIDDAITLWKTAEDEWDVHIHIADVATLLASNPWLQKAASIGQSIYRDGAVVVGMLPAVAEGACSLLPHQRRKALTLAFRCFTDGMPDDFRWLYEEIVVTESYTYETILGTPHAAPLKEIASSLKGVETDDPHEWIEELMLLYNRQAAAVLRQIGQGVLRKHSAPDWELLSYLEGFREVPNFLAYKAGEYCAANDSNPQHWGLDSEFYTHASSPIRRWADCINQTVLLNHFFGAKLPQLADTQHHTLNANAKRARAYERDLFFVRTLLGGGANEMMSGIVLSVDAETRMAKLWVPAWKRIVNVKRPLDGWNSEPVPQEIRRLSIYYDMNARNWKKRMVLQLH